MAKALKVSLEHLLLDPNNYRIKNDPLYREALPTEFARPDVQLRALNIVCGEKNAGIQDLLGSFERNGFLPIDQIQVRPYDEKLGLYLVVEGNRRTAALKRMCDGYRNRGAPLGALDPSVFDAVPVVAFELDSDADAMVLMGLKHISGNKRWSDFNQAMYVYDLHVKHGLSSDSICERIAVSKVTVNTYIRTIALIGQYRESDYGDQFVETKFPLFKEIVQNRQLRDYVGWSDATMRAESGSNVSMLFSLISSDSVDDEDSGPPTMLEPAITKRNELRQFAEMICDQAALNYLLKTRDLIAAYSRSSAVAADRTRNLIESLEMDVKAFKAYRVDVNGLTRLTIAKELLAEVIADNEVIQSGTERRALYLAADNAGKTMSSLSIKSYKAFVDFRISGFSQINVIAGANNTGKSTLLEAVNLLLAQVDARTAFGLADKRGKRFSERDGYGWSVEQIPEFEISGTCGEIEATVRLSKGPDGDMSDEDYLTTIEMTSEFGGDRQIGTCHVYRGRMTQDQLAVKQVVPVIFNTPFYNNEQGNYRRYYLRCSEDKIIDRIVGFIKENVHPGVEKIYWDDEARRFKVADVGLPRSVDLSQYGEGMQRVFLLALLFASASNGVVLVDELENAIHPRLLGSFTALVAKLAKEFSVQVFATTHSKECIDGFVDACRTGAQDDFAFIGLVNASDNVRSARVFSGRQYVEACDLADVDLRGVV